jgi:hypothetical protein
MRKLKDATLESGGPSKGKSKGVATWSAVFEKVDVLQKKQILHPQRLRVRNDTTLGGRNMAVNLLL